MSLPKEFLTDIAREYELSPEQEKVFVENFSSEKSDLEIAKKLHISDSAVRTRMTNVYKKFSITGKRPGKRAKLLNFLVDKYRRTNLSKSNQVKFLKENMNDLVKKNRLYTRENILENCGTMRVLDMSQPIGLNDIYTKVNILEKITGQRRKDISQLSIEYNADNFERFEIGKVTQKRVPGIEIIKRYSKLMVLGKPGAGKTTFLKYLAIQCIGGNLLTNFLPIFITLRQFAETQKQPSLLEYITQIFSDGTVSVAEIDSIFKNGRALILLDGLDEVRETDNHHVLKQILHFSTQYPHNKFVITCRIAAWEYNFEKFTAVEVADFDDEQINNFANNWFKSEDTKIADKFINKLNKNQPIKELATNPLLLTLLCLEFEDYLDFPANRSELYERGVSILLSKWDAKRGIERDQVYKRLSLRRKEDLLSQIALKTFERGDYFFKQKELKQNIAVYIYNLPDAQTDPDALLIDSEAVLKSIEAQHGLFVERARGIYSFSHLTFHEYFTARGLYTNYDDLKKLVNHITETRWREVLILVAGMLQNADDFLLLMKEKINNLLARDEKLQQFLEWLREVTLLDSDFTPLDFRAFYLCLEYVYSLGIFDRDEFLELASFFGIPSMEEIERVFFDFITSTDVSKIDESQKVVYEIHEYLLYDLLIDKRLYDLLQFDRYSSFDSKNYLASEIDDLTRDGEYIDLELKQALQKLKDELPDPNPKNLFFDAFWTTDNKDWVNKLRKVIIEHRNIGHSWQFIPSQIELLQKYYDANVILIECLRSDCFVTREVRNKIEDELFLPIAEIEKRKEQK